MTGSYRFEHRFAGLAPKQVADSVVRIVFLFSQIPIILTLLTNERTAD